MPELSKQQLRELLAVARTAALEAGKAIMQVYASGDVQESQKSDASPLTLADRAAHSIIMEHLARTCIPVLSEEGELADYEARQTWQQYWLVDPLDGTKEFLKQNGEFTVNIALVEQNQPVAGVIYAPVPDTLYVGAAGGEVVKEKNGETTTLQPSAGPVTVAKLLEQPTVTVVASRSHLTSETIAFIEQFPKVKLRSMGSSLKFMLLAEGKADVYPRYAPTMEWDTAAAHAILRVLGKGIYHTHLQTELHYNKLVLLNPAFIAM